MNAGFRSFDGIALVHSLAITMAMSSVYPLSATATDPAIYKKKRAAEYDADIDRATAAFKMASQRGDKDSLQKADAKLMSGGKLRQEALWEDSQAGSHNRLSDAASGSSERLGADSAQDIVRSSSSLRADGLRDVEEPLAIYGGIGISPLAGYDNELPYLEDDLPSPNGVRVRDIRPIGPAKPEDELLQGGLLEDLYTQRGAPDHPIPSGRIIL